MQNHSSVNSSSCLIIWIMSRYGCIDPQLSVYHRSNLGPGPMSNPWDTKQMPSVKVSILSKSFNEYSSHLISTCGYRGSGWGKQNMIIAWHKAFWGNFKLDSAWDNGKHLLHSEFAQRLSSWSAFTLFTHAILFKVLELRGCDNI